MSEIEDLIDSEKFGILCSDMDGQPYSNLMAVMPFDDHQSLIFITARTTRKYINLKKNPKASVFIDNRKNKSSDCTEAKGVNACGEAYELPPGRETEKLLMEFLKIHPLLEDFVKSPTTAVFKLAVKTYYFVENFQEVTEVHLK
jgi:uncharacterized pyridoxamine 5'-phosphate oxidase family protein